MEKMAKALVARDTVTANYLHYRKKGQYRELLSSLLLIAKTFVRATTNGEDFVLGKCSHKCPVITARRMS
ncbi:hypothetical protein PanWU01x14_235970 [Parasponia andersonii]|uniref:Uncharacterized protein n=1 Tax=Parasponia andersonii TaxID=3476 RepID=A0A2P5BIL5_PARAD|nr:hypothetical protein PanWU01x14_235970 [Parasponia andersonii]